MSAARKPRFHFEQLKQDVKGKPKTLFIVIADECHWGITKDKEQTQRSAHNLFINEWCEDSPRNVVVLQISATPFNLLTKNSRLPEVKCTLLSEKTSTIEKNYEAGKPLVLESEPELGDHVKQTSKVVELHVVHWSEVELRNLKNGMCMKLKSTLHQEDSPYQYLQVSSHGKLGVTSSEEEATDFIVKGNQGIVTIQAMVNAGQLLTIATDTSGNLEARDKPAEPAKFEVKLDFGVGIAAFCLCGEGGIYLGVDEHGVVNLQVAKVEWKCGVSIIKPKQDVARVSFQFYVDQCWPVDVGQVGKRYMSLNYYLGTMNCYNKKDQNIRQDESFQRMVNKAKRENKLSKTGSPSFKIDALLCAEYCYYILHVSIYDHDDKIRHALNTDNDKSPTAQLAKALDTFFIRLSMHKEEDGTKGKYIPQEAFEFVRKEIRDMVEKDFRDNLKQLETMQKNNIFISDDDEEKFTESFVAFLIHHSEQELRKIKEETHAAGIFEYVRVEQKLQENDCQKMVEIWNSLVQECETNSLVNSLIQSGKGQLGKMKIIRAKSMETANQFYNTLQLVREMSSLEECFEIIKDYGGIQIKNQLVTSNPFFRRLQTEKCQAKIDCPYKELRLQPRLKKCVNCKHVHKSITQYEDLENLACVLILVDKGRMGDTFPQSFDCLDLRLSYDSKPLYLSTVIQELGRMCRYAKVSTNESHAQNLPYALIGRKLFRELKESVKRSPSITTAISRDRKANKVDRYMTEQNSNELSTSSPLRWPHYEATNDSYDHGNQQKHCNRILLQAEPQIGKTGTYLCLIKLLRVDILGKEKVLSTETSCDEGAMYFVKQCDAADQFLADGFNNGENWQFPYWETIQNFPSLNNQAVATGKYSIGGCFYTHDMEENPLILMKHKGLEQTRSNHHYQISDVTDDLRAWHWFHFVDCSECGVLLEGKEPVLETVEVIIDGIPISVSCSLPCGFLQHSNLPKEFKSSGFKAEGWYYLTSSAAASDVPALPYWIFHPSHRDDPRKCVFNYHHVMQEKNRLASYVQVAVVRREKFLNYRAIWGKVLAIFQLPDKLPNCEVGADEGGIGYARLFIQKFAFALHLEYIYVIDDNVAMMREAEFSCEEKTKFSVNIVRDKHGVMKMQRCSFLKPLIHLQKIAEGKDIPPDDENHFKPHPLKEQFEAQKFPLYGYTGPAKLFDEEYPSYGVLGLLRSVPRVMRPFSKTQVYAMVLLNVKSTVEKKVFYRQWPCWEDLRFNDDCDKAGLWVVKCNRYLFYKYQYKDWIKSLALPCIYQWTEDSTVADQPPGSELPKDLEEGIILEHLRNLIRTEGPDKCFKGHFGYSCQEDDVACEQGGTNTARRRDSNSASNPMEILEQLEIKKLENTSSNRVPVLILSYNCGSNPPFECFKPLKESYCNPKKKIVLVVSANEVKETMTRKGGMTLAVVQDGFFFPCFPAEMRNRNGKVAIFSAADPRRHNLQWIVIEVSFSTQLREANDGNGASGTSSSELSKEARSEMGVSSEPRESIRGEQRGIKRSVKKGFHKLEPKRLLTENQGRHDAERNIDPDSKEIDCQEEREENRGLLVQSNKSSRHKRCHGTDPLEAPTSENPKVDSTGAKATNLEIDVTHLNPAQSTKVLAETTETFWASQADDGHEISCSNNTTTAETEIATTQQRDNLSSSFTSSQVSDTNLEMTENMAGSSTDVNAAKQDGKTLLKDMDSVKSQITKLTPNSPAYLEGTNDVTKAVVDLWKDKVKEKSDRDLEKERVQKALNFELEKLEQHDDKGYTALTKACSLPSFSRRVVSYLISEKKVDVKSSLPSSFNVDDPAAIFLAPGMSALSVAIRRGNIKSVKTFMNRKSDIDFLSKDHDGNTALHHCLLPLKIPKSAFDDLFPHYETMEWREMRNGQGKNPLDIATERWNKLGTEKEKNKETLEHVLNIMDPSGKWN